LLEAIDDAWRNRRDAAMKQAERIAELVTKDLDHAPEPVELDPELAIRAARALLTYHDRTNGGFGGAPKFPQPAYLELLMGLAWDEPDVAACVSRTLDRMASGGIFDQIGGGFHRYAVDAVWGVPHFEKMLYDNAQLASIYARSAARHNDRYHAEVARRIVAYVLNEMRDADGTFYSAQDAEVDAREGKSYVWTKAELTTALAGTDAADLTAMATAMYGLDGGTNFQDPHHTSEPPSNVLVLSGRPEAAARALGLDESSFAERRARIDAALVATRRTRKQPITDDKILTGWNGLVIAALADVGRLLGDPKATEAAEKAADAIDKRMRAADGGLLRSARGATSSIPAFLEDYAFLMRGRIALYDATSGSPRASEHLQRAEALFAEADRLFRSPRGGYFDSREGANELFVRSRGVTDGAVPSGNGMMLLNALDLLRITRSDRYRDELRRTLGGLSGIISEQPIGTALSTVALWRASREAPDVLPGGQVNDGLVAVAIERGPAEGSFAVHITLAQGFHIAAHEPGDKNLIGLMIELRGPGRIALEYPEGEVYSPSAGEATRIHRGTVVIPFRLEATDETSRLAVRTQPCDDRACRRPRTAVVAIPR
jgi:uncharacterized protein